MEGQRASQRAAYPGPGIERPVLSGRRGVLPCWGPVTRVAQWQDSDRCSEPALRQGSRTAAGGGHRRSGGCHGAWRDPVPPPCTTPRSPNRFHLVRALTGLSHTGRAGRPTSVPALPARFYTLTRIQSTRHGRFLACASPCDIFQPCCFRSSSTPLPHPVFWRSDPGRSRSLSSYWLSRAGPAGRLTPRRTTALRESSRRGRAQRAPARSTPGVATSLVTDAWRKGGCGARDLRPTLHRPGPRRAGRWHCAVTVPGRWGDAPQLCGPDSREGT